MTERIIIFDTGVLISLVLNGLLPELKELKKIFKGKFIITKQVKYEVIDRPMQIKRFELEALKINELVDEKVIEFPDSLNISDDEIKSRTEEILNVANSTFYSKGRAIEIIHSGEASCLALSKILKERGIKSVIAVDERTTRVLSESPENMKHLMGKRLHTKIDSNKKNYEFFSGFAFIRSTELMYVAYKKGLVRYKKGPVLDALLYGLKFKGASISDEEIEQMKRM